MEPSESNGVVRRIANALGAARPPAPWRPADTRSLALVTVCGAVVRLVYLALVQGLPPYDPWRHLVLFRSLRAGAGFTIFDGQPYIFYQPPWYVLCTWFPETVRPEWIATCLSILCVPLIWVLVRQDGGDRFATTGAALLAAAYGPLVRYTCHVGPEAFALTLMLGAFVIVRLRPGVVTAGLAGLAFALALVVRMNYVFAGLLLLPGLRRPRDVTALGVGAAIPLGLAWWRNHEIIRSNEWLFAWDGVAAAARDFNPLSTLVIQMHPAVREGLARLHEILAPTPEWLGLGPIALFVALAVICLMFARHAAISIAFAVAFAYFLWFDASATAHFYRIWTGLFPLMLIGIARTSSRLAQGPDGSGKLFGGALLALALLLGASHLAPPSTVALETVTPPPALLTADAYMVNGTYFHPESVIWRFPEKRFIGLPLDPEKFPEFRRAYPGYAEAILWHDFSVQEPLRQALLRSGEYRVAASERNADGRMYWVLRRRSSSTMDGR